MGVITRGIKNAFRNGVRTLSISLILALSLAMALIMFMAMKTVETKINSVKSSIGNTITVSPAGVRGFEGGGELLTSAQADQIAAIGGVKSVSKIVEDRLTSTDTNLVTPIQPGSFGNRQRNIDSGQARTQSQNGTGGNPSGRSFSMPITIAATNNLDLLSSLNLSQLNITDGTTVDVNGSDNVALVGKDMAAKNNLSVGSTFTAYGKDVTVSGIFDGGNTFGNAAVIMPVQSLQTLSGQTGQFNSFVVESSSIDTMSSVTDKIKSDLGIAVDVVSSQDRSNEAIAPLQNIKTISFYSLIGSLAAGSVIILLAMVMIVRERRREIGVLKAIGSSNAGVVFQFISEALTLTLVSSVIGIILGAIFSNPILKVLVNNSTTAVATAPSGGGAGRQFGRGVAAFGNAIPGAQNTIRNLSASVDWHIILYGLGAAIVIAIIGSAIPAFLIAKVRPAEVMRSE